MADAATAAIQAAATATAAPSIPTDSADSDWEYEYSTTETETHLITLDLSVPEFVRQRDDVIVHNTRGGFRSWQNPMNMDDVRPFRGFGGDDSEDGGDGDGKALAEDSDREDTAPTNKGGAAAAKSAPPAPADEQDATEIQILDLHAAEPVIAYRGMLFKGTWSETIGTEMLFADRPQGEEPAPNQLAGVHLTDDIDVVGASSARIACTPTEMMPKAAGGVQKAVPAKGTAKAAKKGLGFVIPVSNNASVQRQQQASFLEQLMALKHRNGEADVVTVQALETKQNAIRNDALEVKRRARRETQLQVHQERRAKRLRGALDGIREGGGVAAAASAAADVQDTTMLDSPGAQGQPIRRRRTGPRRGRGRASDRSQISRVAGDDDLLAMSARAENDTSQNNVSNDRNDRNNDDGKYDELSSDEDYEDVE
ncbi:hypothetical protein Sste5346_008472 [Sporothrix stenoceras]|uniref:Transcription factor TFIIIC triple barrel domain-containing protein n=1 Tax=Sporothrix stenoceras TaxID=5173 RepID=A0ABR3YQ20_9PEZI